MCCTYSLGLACVCCRAVGAGTEGGMLGLFVAEFAFQEGGDLLGDFLCLFLRKDRAVI